MRFLLHFVTKGSILPHYAPSEKLVWDEIWTVTCNSSSGKSQRYYSKKQMHTLGMYLRLWNSAYRLWNFSTRWINYKLWLLSQRSDSSHDSSYPWRILYRRVFQLEAHAKALLQSKRAWIQNSWRTWNQSMCTLEKQFCELLERHGAEAYSETFYRQDRQ